MKRSTLVYGPPGTGKTTYGINLVAEALAAGVNPQRIAYLSYTRAGATEAKHRALDRFWEVDAEDFRYFRTVHSICYHALGLTREQVLTRKRLAEEFGSEYKLGVGSRLPDDEFEVYDNPLRELGDMMDHFDEWRRNRLLTIDEGFEMFLRESGPPSNLPEGFALESTRRYIERKTAFKRESNLWDFQDMVLDCLRDRVMIDVDLLIADESQDMFPLVMRMAQTWSSGAQQVYWLGDPNQSIYGFLGAAPEQMLGLYRDQVIPLRQSHRVPRVAHDLSRTLITRNKTRLEDDDYTPAPREGQVERLAESQVDWHGIVQSGGGFLLDRTRWLMSGHQALLRQKGVPFESNRGAGSPLQREECRMLVTLLRLRGGERVNVREVVGMLKGVPAKDYLVRGTKKKLEQMAQEQPSAMLGMDSFRHMGFKPVWFDMVAGERFAEVLKVSQEDREYLLAVYRQYGQAMLEGIRTGPSVVMDTMASGGAGRILLSTIHGVKGMQAEHVVINPEITRRVEEGMWSPARREEENRVFYVAVTRTKNRLTVLHNPMSRSYQM